MLRIAERSTSTWHYHLHEDNDDPKFCGGMLTMLCDETMHALNTKIPVSSWGYKSHIPSSYCGGCTKVKEKTSG